MQNKKTNQFSIRLTKEQMEKVASVKRQQKISKDTDSIKKIIDWFVPTCERCQDKAKRVVVNRRVKFLCEDCLEILRPVSFTKEQWDEA